MSKKRKTQKITAWQLIFLIMNMFVTIFSIGLYFWIEEFIFNGDKTIMLIVAGIVVIIGFLLGLLKFTDIKKKL